MASGFGIALQLVGTAALLASIPATGGLSVGLAIGGIAAIGAATALSTGVVQPEPISQVHRQTTTTSDPEAPWEWVYGEVVKGGALAWTGVGGGEDQYLGADIVLACHPCDSLVEVQVGDWCFPIVTSVDGNTAYNGLGLMLNTGQALSTNFPADYYVPVHGGVNGSSAWWRQDQGDVNEPDEAHIAIKFNPGDQTATDAGMAQKFGTKYSSVARKFTGHTVAHVILLANTVLGTVGGVPEILWRIKGKNDVQNHLGAGAYRNNCAHVFADYCREHLGIPVTDIVNLQTAATECDDTTWSGAGGAERYKFDGVIRDDEEPTEVLRRICEHMAGGYAERGDKIIVWTGTVKTTWVDGPLTYDDLAGDDAIDIIPPDEDGWTNTLIPHRVVLRALDEDGKRIIHGRMEPTRDVTRATYVTEDAGVVLRQDVKFPACTMGRRAIFTASIALEQSRLGASMRVRAKKRAIVLEPGDVFSANFPDFFPNGTKFQVGKKRELLGADTFAVELDTVRYEDAIYTPGTTPTEDAIGVVAKNRSSDIPQVTGLAAAVLEDSSGVNANGKLTIDVVISWTLVPNRLVRMAGDVRVAWKRQSASTWHAKTVPGDEIQTVIPGLRQGIAFHVRARALGTPTAGRTEKPRGPWSTTLGFTPQSGQLDMDGPPTSGTEGSNRISDGNFERGPNSGVWDLDDETATATGSATIETTGGRFGPHRARITITSAIIGDQYRIRNLVPMSVSQGEWYRLRWAVAKPDAGDPSFRPTVMLHYRDSAFVIQETHSALDNVTVNDLPWPDKRFVARFQVPVSSFSPIVWLQVQPRHDCLSSGAQESVWDGLVLQEILGMRSVTVSTELETNDTVNWSNLVTLDDFPEGDETDIFFDGETEVTIEGVVRASVKRGASDVTSRTRAVARLRLEEVAVATTTIVTQVRVALIEPGEVSGSGNSGDDDDRILSATLTPTAGHYKVHLEGRMQGDSTNGTAEFKERFIRIRKT